VEGLTLPVGPRYDASSYDVMSILNCFQSGTVVSDLASPDKYQAIGELIRRAPVFSRLPDSRAFEQSVLERERLQSTGIGHGVAVAHGRTSGLERVLIALGRSREGIPFDSPDREPVHLLFVIASPPSLSLDYLQALSTLVRCVRHRSLRESLFAADGAAAIESRIRDAFCGALERSTC
jgi:nitrogen PTS system EIIA component